MLLAFYFHALELAFLEISQQVELEILKAVIADFFDEPYNDGRTGEGLARKLARGHLEHGFAIAQDVVGDLAFPLGKMVFAFQFLQQFHSGHSSGSLLYLYYTGKRYRWQEYGGKNKFDSCKFVRYIPTLFRLYHRHNA